MRERIQNAARNIANRLRSAFGRNRSSASGGRRSGS